MNSYYIAIITDNLQNTVYLCNYDSQIVYKEINCLPYLDLTDVNLQSSLTNEKELSIIVLKKDLSINFSQARIEIIYFNNSGVELSLYKGIVFAVTNVGLVLNLSIKPISYLLRSGTGNFFSQSCRAELGDRKCGKSLQEFTFSGKIESVLDVGTFTGSHPKRVAGYFNGGRITFNLPSGDFSSQVLDDNGDSFSILLKPEQDLQIGVDYIIVAGCDKTLNTCINRFNNAINFRGEPYIL